MRSEKDMVSAPVKKRSKKKRAYQGKGLDRLRLWQGRCPDPLEGVYHKIPSVNRGFESIAN